MKNSYYLGYKVEGVSKRTGEGTVYVRIKGTSVSGQDFDTVKSTRVKVNPKHFRNGKVTARDELHTEKNKLIGDVRFVLAAIADDLTSSGLIPDRQRVAQELKIADDAVEGFREAKAGLYADLSEKRLQLLRDVEELELQLSEKRRQLHALEIKLNIKPAPLPLSKMFEAWWDLRESGKVGKRKAKPGTLKNISVLANAVARFAPTAVLSDVDLDFFIDFQRHLIDRGVTNKSTLEFIGKFRTAFIYFARKNNIKTDFLADFKYVEEGDDNEVIFLTADEIAQIEALNLKGHAQIEVRRQFLFAVETGLRRSDYQIKKSNIKGKELEILTRKNRKVARIPFTKKANRLFEESGYDFRLFSEAQFNQTLRGICKKVPSLNEYFTVYRYIGEETIADARMKWEFISSHVARKTYAYNALAKGASTLAVAEWLGHKTTKMLDKYYANKTELARREAYKITDAE